MNELTSELVKAIQLFEIKANELINLLAQEFNLDLNQPHPFAKLISRKNDLWKGQLLKDWNYQFHGDACRFIHNTNNQLVDVKIIRGKNYGAITSFYLMKFIETTPKLENLASKIMSEQELITLIHQLIKEEVLIDRGDELTKTIMLNKSSYSADHLK